MTFVVKKSRNKMLGLAVSERSISVAEVASHGGKPELIRVGEFVYPPGVSLDDPTALGRALGQFLKQQGFSTRSAVLGIPAKWVLSKQKEVPPANAQIVAESLRLQAEGDFSPELKDLVYDYAGQPNESEAGTVLLMAVPRRYIQQMSAIAQGAHLSAVAVTPSASALGAVSARSGKNSMALVLGSGGAEWSVQHGPDPRVLRHLGPAGTVPMPFIGELRRAMMMAPRHHNGSTNGNGQALTLWDGIGLDPPARRALGEALGIAVREGNLRSLGIEGESTPESATFAPAVSLALTALDESQPPVDFLHAKLAEPQKSGLDRRLLWGAIVAGALLLLGIIMLVDLKVQASSLAAAQTELTTMQPSIDSAKKNVEKIAHAQTWHAGKPRYLACLLDLTRLIPDDGQVYATSFDLHDNMKGQLNGKASDQRAALMVSESLKRSGSFKNVTTPSVDARQSGRTGHEVSFSISFVYQPKN